MDTNKMARFSWSYILCLGVLVSLIHSGAGTCGPSRVPVTSLCESGTVSGKTFFLQSNTYVDWNVQCECDFSVNASGKVEIYPVPFLTRLDCSARIQFSEDGQRNYFYALHCLQDKDYSVDVSAGSRIKVDVTGPGQVKTCISVSTQSDGMSISMTCSKRTLITAATTQPSTQPSTQPPTQPPTQPSTQPPTQPSTQPPTGPTTQPPTGPTTQPSTEHTTQPPTEPPTQPPTGPTTQPPTGSTTQPPTEPTTQPPTEPPTQAPTGPTTQPPTGSTTQPPTEPTTQPPTGTKTQPPSTQPPTQNTPGPSTAFSRFPVEAVAGGVGGGLILIILLVICITCCTARRRPDRKPDEEMLRGRDSPEMTEKEDPNPMSFNNQLYYESGMGTPGKSVTPTVSDAGTDDYHATRGLDELYASVNKTITDSTDIM